MTGTPTNLRILAFRNQKIIKIENHSYLTQEYVLCLKEIIRTKIIVGKTFSIQKINIFLADKKNSHVGTEMGFREKFTFINKFLLAVNQIRFVICDEQLSSNVHKAIIRSVWIDLIG